MTTPGIATDSVRPNHERFPRNVVTSRARKGDQRTLARKLAVLTLPDCDATRLTVPTLGPMTGHHVLELVIFLSRNPWVVTQSSNETDNTRKPP